MPPILASNLSLLTTAYCFLPTAALCLLLSAYCRPLPSAFCLLPSAFCFLPSALSTFLAASEFIQSSNSQFMAPFGSCAANCLHVKVRTFGNCPRAKLASLSSKTIAEEVPDLRAISSRFPYITRPNQRLGHQGSKTFASCTEAKSLVF